jgi:hypothetical protein
MAPKCGNPKKIHSLEAVSWKNRLRALIQKIAQTVVVHNVFGKKKSQTETRPSGGEGWFLPTHLSSLAQTRHLGSVPSYRPAAVFPSCFTRQFLTIWFFGAFFPTNSKNDPSNDLYLLWTQSRPDMKLSLHPGPSRFIRKTRSRWSRFLKQTPSIG